MFQQYDLGCREIGLPKGPCFSHAAGWVQAFLVVLESTYFCLVEI
jgi:hypothetical protein